MPPLQGVCGKQPQEAWGTQLGPCQQEGNGSSEKRRGFAVFSGDATSSKPGRDVGSGGGGLWGQMRGYSADGGQQWEHEVDSSQTLRIRSTSWRSQRGGPQEGPGQIPRRPPPALHPKEDTRGHVDLCPFPVQEAKNHFRTSFHPVSAAAVLCPHPWSSSTSTAGGLSTQ